MKDTKILIIGGYGCNNLGDDAQLYNNIRLLKEKEYKDITIMSHGSYISNLCSCPIVPNFRAVFGFSKNITPEKIYDLVDDYNNSKLKGEIKSFFDNIYNTDILFFSGSGTINTRQKGRLFTALMPCLIAKVFNKKVILSGQGFMPLSNKELEKIIALVLKKVDLIVTREFKLGERELKRIGIDNFILGIDDAFTTPPKEIELKENTIAINASCYADKEIIKVLRNIANKLKDDGFNIIFTCFHPKDRKTAEICSENKFPIKLFKDPNETAGFYNKVEGSIGMRYHSTIFALAGRKPTVNITKNIYQESKLKAIQENTKIPHLYITNKEIEKNLYNTFYLAMKSQKEYLERTNKKWKEKSNLAIKLMDNIK